MKLQIEKWERWFLYGTVVMLVAFLVAVLGSIGEAGIHLPTDEDQVDVAALQAGNAPAPFDQLGVFPADDDPDVDYRVVMLARAWTFDAGPENLADGIMHVTVPAGSTVEFVTTSVDTIHGFLIGLKAANAMIIPGQITKLTVDFDEAGTHNILCHEYCGLLHHNMYGTVEVTS